MSWSGIENPDQIINGGNPDTDPATLAPAPISSPLAPKANKLMQFLKKRQQMQSDPNSQGQKFSPVNTWSNVGSLAGTAAATFLAKGGIVDRPTNAVIGEAGPEAVIPLTKPLAEQHAQLARYQGLARRQNPVPEKKDTLDIQVEQLAGGKRKAVLFPPGSDAPKRPEGIRQMRTEDGIVYYDPAKITPPEIKQAAQDGSWNAVLGDAQEGYGAPQKQDLSGEPVAVSAEAGDGTPVQDVATDAPHLSRTVSAARRVTPPSGRVKVHSPVDVIKGRVRKFAGGGYVDQPTNAVMGEEAPEAVLDPTDPQSQQELDYYNRMLKGDPQAARRLADFRSKIEQRQPAYTPSKPGIWQKLAAGAVGAAAGYSNAARRARPVDPSQAEKNILYPGLQQNKAAYDAETARLEKAYEMERQAKGDDLTELQRYSTLQNIRSEIERRKAQTEKDRREEVDKFTQSGGQMQSTTPQGGTINFPPQAPPEPPQVTTPVPPPIGPPTEEQAGPTIPGPFGPKSMGPPPQVSGPPPNMPPSMPTNSTIAGRIGNSPGYNSVPSAPYDPKGTRRVMPTKEELARQAQEAKQVGWIALPPDIAKWAGMNPTDKLPPEQARQFVADYNKEQRDANKPTKEPTNEYEGILREFTDANGTTDYAKANAEFSKRQAARKAVNNISLSGDALDTAADTYLKTGQLPNMGMGGSTAKLNIMNRAAERAIASGTAADPSTNAAIYKSLSGEVGQLQKLHGLTSAFEANTKANMGLLEQASTATDRTGIPLVNKYLLAVKKNVWGDPDAAKLRDAIRTVANEVAKVRSGQQSGTATDSARAEAMDSINDAMTKGQLSAVLQQMRQEMQNRTGELQNQIIKAQDNIRALGHGAPAPEASNGAQVTAPPGRGGPVTRPPLSSFEK